MSDKLVCPICGAPTRVYMGNARKDRLCGKHADELKAGKIEKCGICGEWHYINEPCKCAKKILSGLKCLLKSNDRKTENASYAAMTLRKGHCAGNAIMKCWTIKILLIKTPNCSS